MADNLYSDGAIPQYLEDVNPDNNPYNLLSKAIEDMNSSLIIDLYDNCERDIFLITVVSAIDNILAHGSDDLLYFLGNKLITHEYTDIYNKLFMVNEFRKAVKDKNTYVIMQLTSHINEKLYLPYIIKNLDELLKTSEVWLCSQLATCLVTTIYRDEYDRVCKKIKYLIEPGSSDNERYRERNVTDNEVGEWQTYPFPEVSSSSTLASSHNPHNSSTLANSHNSSTLANSHNSSTLANSHNSHNRLPPTIRRRVRSTNTSSNLTSNSNGPTPRRVFRKRF